ncbi:cupin domain-containing protein [Peptoniphilus sp. KCTC 25270]|uniref:cupin domain-containing protein n=1 Tax=Peptoniphilus sp. KCTC 25270 TaxID=2897414 RepID=UPI001E46FF03|nr:cupin domain-containing protein [Peptoniphilus sp. KCTC 25270]MCD1147805.1 cupin domain-containing protein [Peptoniphilus sp. KCTC 25270]
MIKNYPIEEVCKMSQQIDILPGQVVSKTLAQNHYVSLTLFAFSAGEEISTHGSNGDALVHVLEGEGRFVVDGHEFRVKEGETLLMPAEKPHSVHGDMDFKMLLTVVFPIEEE